MELTDIRTKARYVFLDYARIIVAFLVIYGHLYTPNPHNFVRVFIYQFHMAFFFFVSGLFHKYCGRINYEKYAKKILVPMIFFVGVFFLLILSSYFPGGGEGILKQIANSLITILGMQVVFIFLVDNIIGFNLSYPISLLIAICIMTLCFFSHMIISKYFPKISGLK